MKETLRISSEYAVLLIDGMALVIVLYAAVEAFVRGIGLVINGASIDSKRNVWLRFMRLLVAALTFLLAADIIETITSTTWEALGRIGAIALIRTFLNYFLERDVGEMDAKQRA